MADSPDFSGYFGSLKLTDCTVILVEEPPPGCGSAKRRQQELPGHSMVLVAFSGYCKAKLESWDSARAAEDGGQNEYFVLRKRIEVQVPTGQLELGLLLLQGMYCPGLELDLPQMQLLQLLLLADRYEVPKVAKAVAAAFAAIPIQQLQWESVLVVYRLPVGCVAMEGCRSLLTAAAAKLQDELGDLELVWSSSSKSSSTAEAAAAAAAAGGSTAADDPAATAELGPNKQQQLLGLPFAALAALLSDDKTRVSFEYTVFYTIERWYTHQQQQQQQQQHEGFDVQQQQQQQPDPVLQTLLRQFRMRHCGRLDVLAMAHSSLAHVLFSWEQLMLGGCLAADGVGDVILNSACPVLRKYPAWSAGRRPASSVQQLAFEWALPVSELQLRLQTHLTGMEEAAAGDLTSPVYAWRGQEVAMALRFKAGVTFGYSAASVYAVLSPGPGLLPSVVRKLSGVFSMHVLPRQQQQQGRRGQQAAAAAAAADGLHWQRLGSIDKSFSGTKNHGVKLPSWGTFSNAVELQQALEQQGMVHDGCVWFKLRVTGLF